MQKENAIQELFKKHEKLRDEVGNYFSELRIDNVRQIRDLVKHFIIISSAIIGFVLPVFGSSNLVKNSTSLIGGLFELLIVVLYGFYYLKKVLEKENKELSKQHKQYNRILDKWRDSIIALASSKNSGSVKKFTQTTQKILSELNLDEKSSGGQQEYALDIIFSAFLAALILIIFSMVNVSWPFTP